MRKVSEVNEALYRTYVSPWVQALSNPWTAEALKWLHPMRTSRYLLSDRFNPRMRSLEMLADTVARRRRPLPQEEPLIQREREAIKAVGQALENARKGRDEHFDELLNETMRKAPLRRTVEACEVGRAALLLASDYTSAITGTVLYVDAGFHIECMGVPLNWGADAAGVSRCPLMHVKAGTNQ